MRVFHLSKSARDEFIQNLSEVSGKYAIRSKDLKIAEADDSSLAIIFDENERIFVGRRKSEGKDGLEYFPLLKDESILPSLPKITVDSGAVKFLCNGANVMRPGIVTIEGTFNSSDLVVIKEQKHGKAIAVGRVTVSRPEMETTTKGAVVTNLHYVGDKLWDMLKEINA